MYRAKSVQQFSIHTSQDSSRLDIPTAPYNNAKLKPFIKGRLFPWLWAEAVLMTRQTQTRVAQLLLFLLVVGVWALYLQAKQQATQPRHLIVLDAGSTGTRVHVFQYAADSGSSYAAIKLPEPKLKVHPGLSAYANDAAGAAASLQPLLQFAAQHIPSSQAPRTPVYLMATAGLRLLPPLAAEAILEECRSVLLDSDFLFEPDWAQIISGTYEGLYAWVAANYAAGHLQAAAEDAAQSRKDLHAGHTTFKALIEMGGASAQVTFMPDAHWHQHSAPSSKQRVRLKLPGVDHPLWAHSYLGYGLDVVQAKVDKLVSQLAAHSNDTHAPAASATGSAAAAEHGATHASPADGTAAQASVAAAPSAGSSQHTGAQQQVLPLAVHVSADGVVDPCLPAGYRSVDGRLGSGVWQQCQQLVEVVIDPAACKPVHDTPCPELPDNMPRLAGELLAIENFAYTAHALSLPAVASLGEFATAARSFCSRPWPQTVQEHSADAEQQAYLWRYCFGSAFAWTLLHRVLHVSEGQQLHWTNELQGHDGAALGLDWALGAAVLQLANNSAAEGARLEQLRERQQVLLLAALAATAVLAVWVAAAAQGAWRSRKLSQQPPWLTLGIMPAAVAGSKAAAAAAAVSWGSMVGSAWANGIGRGSVKAGYDLVYQQYK